jgi:hypothetical protein
MSEPVPAPARPADWWTRPRAVLPIVGAFVVLLALLTPQPSLGRLGDARLSSRLSGSLGARALAETAERFGFRVERRDSVGAPTPTAARGHTIHAVLAPPMALTAAEAHAYLDAVRGGDALLLVFDGRNALSDSLGLWRTESGTLDRLPVGERYGCRRDLTPPLWPDGTVHLYGLRWLRGAPRDRVVFAPLRANGVSASVPGEAAAGFALGRGRIVAIPDPDLLRNDVVRRCDWGADVLAMRMLEWLRAGGEAPRTSLVFDEYHHGFGRSPSALGTAAAFLVAHPVGRAILVLTVAALVLLLAVAPRALPPIDVEREERRDPLEQVDALAHAYEQVGATRTMVARLVRGVRWRAARGSPAARLLTDDAFLAGLAATDPARRADAARIARALREPVAPRDLPEIAAALRRLEESLTTTHA